MAVVKLLDFKNRETVCALRALLQDALGGRIAGLAVCYRTAGGAEESVFTGAYKSRPADAVNAAMRLSWKLTQAQDALTGPPN